MRRKSVIIIGLISVLLFLKSSFAEEMSFFQSKASYDIYLEGTDYNLSVITDVEIIRVQEIYGRTFLVVRPADFTLDPKEGFILFESVRAILPNNKLKPQNTNRINVKY